MVKFRFVKLFYLFLILTVAVLMITTVFADAEHEGGRRSLSFWDIWALPRVWVGALLALAGLLLLMTKKLNHLVRFIFLLLIFFAFAIVAVLPLGGFAAGMGLHPSPMCSVEKPFMFMQMGKAVPIVFIAILAFIVIISLIANKMFCGWNCPIGALQEMLHRIPLPKKWKITLPFKVTNSIRILFFLLFLVVLFSTGLSLYAYVNPFEFLHWSLAWAIIPAFLLTFIAALFIFRPFCYIICPLGLLTWFVEHASLIRVRVDAKACTMCMRCVKASPCPAVPAILQGKRCRPDCHACGICIEECPENALYFK